MRRASFFLPANSTTSKVVLASRGIRVPSFHLSSISTSSSSLSSTILLHESKRNMTTFVSGAKLIQSRIPKPMQFGLAGVAVLVVFLFGYSRGKVEKVENEELSHVPDFDGISNDLLQTYDFRPDLAPTMIRLCFVLCVMRHEFEKQQKQHKEPIEENKQQPKFDDVAWRMCSSFTGLDEAVEVLGFHQLTHPVSMQDLAVIAAITAIKFLKGPFEQLEFRYGRVDDPVEELILAEEAVKKAEREAERRTRQRMNIQYASSLKRDPFEDTPTLTGEKRGFFAAHRAKKKKEQEEQQRGSEGVVVGSQKNNKSEAQKAEEEKRKQIMSFFSQPSSSSSSSSSSVSSPQEEALRAIQEAVPSLTLEHITALMALHGVGDYHSDVSGVERRVKVSRVNYMLSSQYYKTFQKLKFSSVPVELPQSAQNKDVPHLPLMMEAPIQVLTQQSAASSNSNEKKIKKKMMAACPVSEYLLMRNNNTDDGDDSNKTPLREHILRFSDKQFGDQIWRSAFAKAMQTVFDSAVGENVELKKLPPISEVDRNKKKKSANDLTDNSKNYLTFHTFKK